MDAVQFLNEYDRMCSMQTACGCCDYKQALLKHLKIVDIIDFNCGTCAQLTFENAVFSTGYIEEWSTAHPQKTRLQDFLEKYPKALLDERGYPIEICPYHLGYEHEECNGENCEKCWNEPIE